MPPRADSRHSGRTDGVGLLRDRAVDLDAGVASALRYASRTSRAKEQEVLGPTDTPRPQGVPPDRERAGARGAGAGGPLRGPIRPTPLRCEPLHELANPLVLGRLLCGLSRPSCASLNFDSRRLARPLDRAPGHCSRRAPRPQSERRPRRTASSRAPQPSRSARRPLPRRPRAALLGPRRPPEPPAAGPWPSLPRAGR